jgi:hypothetical protein
MLLLGKNTRWDQALTISKSKSAVFTGVFLVFKSLSFQDFLYLARKMGFARLFVFIKIMYVEINYQWININLMVTDN